MVKIKRTVFPKQRKLTPYSNASMSNIYNFWTKDGCSFNYELYLKILKFKKEIV